MTLAFVIQTLGSLVAIGALAALAAWAKIARPVPNLDAGSAQRLFQAECPGLEVEQLWLAADGAAALARSGDQALVIYRLGDGYVARSLPWMELGRARAVGSGRVLLTRDVTAPRVRLAWPENARWPPAPEEAVR
jgi:hypothetical protein